MRLLTGAPLGGGSHATASNRQSSRSVALACFRVARAPPRRAGRGVWCRCERFSACRTSFELVPRRLCVVSDRSQRAGRPSGSFQVLLASLPTVLSVRNVTPVRSKRFFFTRALVRHDLLFLCALARASRADLCYLYTLAKYKAGASEMSIPGIRPTRCASVARSGHPRAHSRSCFRSRETPYPKISR